MGLFSGTRPQQLGKLRAEDGRFRLHPVRKAYWNAVSSFETSAEHGIAPLAARDPQATWQRLISILRQMPGARIVTQDADYLHVECSTRLMGFVDDLECLLDEGQQRIHVRSASRLGRKDFGVNRERVESIRKQLGG